MHETVTDVRYFENVLSWQLQQSASPINAVPVRAAILKEVELQKTFKVISQVFLYLLYMPLCPQPKMFISSYLNNQRSEAYCMYSAWKLTSVQIKKSTTPSLRVGSSGCFWVRVINL